jgi:hypothetical protein
MRQNTPVRAEALHRMGYDLVPLLGKRPLAKWKDPIPIERVISLVERFNADIGFVCGRSNICVLDADSDQAVRELHRRFPPTKQRARTDRGEHWYYQAPDAPLGSRQKLFDIPLDLKAGVAYVRRRVWLTEVFPPGELPVLDPSLLPPKRQTVPPRIEPASFSNERDVEGALRYVNSPRTPGAVAGQQGHKRTLWVASRLLTLFPSLTFDQLMLAMRAFNRKCQPEWSEKELVHKCTDAFKYVGRNPC